MCSCLQFEMVISINMILLPLLFTEDVSEENHIAPMGWKEHPTSYPGYLLWGPSTVLYDFPPLSCAWQTEDPCGCSCSWQGYPWQAIPQPHFWVSFGSSWLTLVQVVQQMWLPVAGAHLSSGFQMKLLMLWRWEANSLIWCTYSVGTFYKLSYIMYQSCLNSSGSVRWLVNTKNSTKAKRNFRGFTVL